MKDLYIEKTWGSSNRVNFFNGLNLIYAGRVTMINLQYSETNDALRLESSGGSSLCHQHCGIFVAESDGTEKFLFVNIVFFVTF